MESQKKQMMKRQFRIGDLAKELKVKKFVIRFWEKEFDLKSDRSQGGQRFYTDEDLDVFFAIKDLLYNQGFTIAGAKKQLPEALSGGASRIVSEDLLESDFADAMAPEDAMRYKDIDDELIAPSDDNLADNKEDVQRVEHSSSGLQGEEVLEEVLKEVALKEKEQSHEEVVLCMPARMALDSSFYENLATLKGQLTRLYELLD